jgi:hypothetical protein
MTLRLECTWNARERKMRGEKQRKAKRMKRKGVAAGVHARVRLDAVL